MKNLRLNYHERQAVIEFILSVLFALLFIAFVLMEKERMVDIAAELDSFQSGFFASTP